MGIQATEQKADLTGIVDKVIRIKGAAAADPVVEFGYGLTVKWISTGLYEITFLEIPGTYVMTEGVTFESSTPASVAGWTGVANNYNSTTRKLQINIYNSTFALANLAATMWAGIVIKTKWAGAGV